jgi:predicted nucleotidyltransferase
LGQDKISEVIVFLKDRLEDSGLQVSRIILFGSQSRNEDTEESDIDLAVVSDSFYDKDTFERSALIKSGTMETIRRFTVPLDIITLTPEELEEETRMIAGYVKKGIVIYPA